MLIDYDPTAFVTPIITTVPFIYVNLLPYMIIDLYAQHNIVVFLDFNKYVPYFTDYGTLQLFLEFDLPNKQIEVFLHNLNTDYLES